MTDPTPNASNKLMIRRHVLTSIQSLSSLSTPSKEAKIIQLERLKALEAPQAVCDVLVKELERCPSTEQRQIVSEFIMELADIDWVRDGLWRIIQSPHAADGIKDTANLILRNLGDDTDPDVYLDYLDDPEALITEETERMLQIATQNPESLIDFIDFIVSLPVAEQLRLLRSLQSDYAPDYLIHLLIPLYWAATPTELKDYIIDQLLKSHLPLARQLLHDVAQYDKNTQRQEKAQQELAKPHLTSVQTEAPLPISTQDNKFCEPAVCYATLPDGIGNQGLLYSRKKENGDTTLIGFALNDGYGLMDCFGFYQLSPGEVEQLIEKFHEESIKISVPEAYCQHKLALAEKFNKAEGSPIPYEYLCWKSVFDSSKAATDSNNTDIESALTICQQLADSKWSLSTQNLYLHPDFETWFIEMGDHPDITNVLKQAQNKVLQGLQHQTPIETLIRDIDEAAQQVVLTILQDPEHKQRFINRLADSALLLNHGDTKPFAPLAATEVMKLIEYAKTDEPVVANCGFIQAFGRRCLTEHLLRMQQHPKQYDVIAPRQLDALVSTILAQWEDAFSLDNIEALSNSAIMEHLE